MELVIELVCNLNRITIWICPSPVTAGRSRISLDKCAVIYKASATNKKASLISRVKA